MGFGPLKNATAATLSTGNGTFALALGQVLALLIGGPNVVIAATQSPIYGGDLVELVVTPGMFAAVGAATATELAAALNAAFVAQSAAGQPAAAVATVSGSAVVITTAQLGGHATLQVLPTSTAALLTALTLSTGSVVKGTGHSIGSQSPSPVYHDVISFTGDTSYPTGGSTGLLAKVQTLFSDGRKPFAILAGDCGGYVPVYIEGTDKLKVYKSAGSAIALAEVANAVDLSGTTFNLVVLSR